MRMKVDPRTGNQVNLASISAVEVLSAIARRQRGGSLPPSIVGALHEQFRHDLGHEYRTVQLGSGIVSKAMDFAEAHALRAYDAVQVAAAFELNRWRAAFGKSPVNFVSSDNELNKVAVALGLIVDNPTSTRKSLAGVVPIPALRLWRRTLANSATRARQGGEGPGGGEPRPNCTRSPCRRRCPRRRACRRH